MTALAGRVLLTGGDGFIGSAMGKVVGAEIFSVSRSDADLTDPRAIRTLFADIRPDHVVHLAAAGVVGGLAHSPELVGRNVEMTANLVNAAPPHCRLVIAGSMSEYGQSGTLREGSVCRPRTAYGISKLAANLYALAYGGEREVVIARLFGVFGGGEPAARLFPSVITQLIAGRPVPLSDGLQLRDFVHVGDVARILIALCTSRLPPAGIVNIGTGTGVRVRDAVMWIAESLGADVALLRFGERERSPGDEDALIADVAMLASLTGSVPPQRLEAGLDMSLFRDF